MKKIRFNILILLAFSLNAQTVSFQQFDTNLRQSLTSLRGLYSKPVTPSGGAINMDVVMHAPCAEGHWLQSESGASPYFNANVCKAYMDYMHNTLGVNIFDFAIPWVSLYSTTQFQSFCTSAICPASDCSGAGIDCAVITVLDTIFTYANSKGYKIRLQGMGGADGNLISWCNTNNTNPGSWNTTVGQVNEAGYEACTKYLFVAAAKRWSTFLDRMTIVQEPWCGTRIHIGISLSVTDMHTYITNVAAAVRLQNGTIPMGVTLSGLSCGYLNLTGTAGTLSVANNSANFTVISGITLRSWMQGLTTIVDGHTYTIQTVTNGTTGTFSAVYTQTTDAAATWLMPYDTPLLDDWAYWSTPPFSYIGIDLFASQCDQSGTSYYNDWNNWWIPIYFNTIKANSLPFHLTQLQMPFYCPTTGTDPTSGQLNNLEPYESFSYNGTGATFLSRDNLQIDWLKTSILAAGANGAASFDPWCPLYLLYTDNSNVIFNGKDNCGGGAYAAQTMAFFSNWGMYGDANKLNVTYIRP